MQKRRGLGLNVLDFRWVEHSTCCCLLGGGPTVEKG